MNISPRRSAIAGAESLHEILGTAWRDGYKSNRHRRADQCLVGLSVPARFYHQRPRFGGVFAVVINAGRPATLAARLLLLRRWQCTLPPALPLQVLNEFILVVPYFDRRGTHPKARTDDADCERNKRENPSHLRYPVFDDGGLAVLA